jgi:uncharacterized protein (TIGR01777 family)
MTIVVTGASGLIGTALVAALRQDGHRVVRLVRRPTSGPDEVRWDPAARHLDPAVVSGTDAVIHLAGVGIGDRRWSAEYQAKVLDSRVDGTTTIATAIAKADQPPPVLLSASAVGWYGDTGDRVVREDEPAGAGFLGEVSQAWEASTVRAADAGSRVVTLRTGLVLSRSGGLLGKLRPLFKAGLGGRMGSGRQYWPWISLRDEVAAIGFLLGAGDVAGPVNLTGPEPVTNAEFTAELARQLHRPALFPVPPFALRIVLAGFADEGVLSGQRAVPAVLTEHGFGFTDPTLADALRYALGD